MDSLAPSAQTICFRHEADPSPAPWPFACEFVVESFDISTQPQPFFDHLSADRSRVVPFSVNKWQIGMDTASSAYQGNQVLEQYELPELQRTSASMQPAPAPATVSANLEGSEAALQMTSDGGVTVQELAPVDRGMRAWTFCFCSFVLETMIWGFCFRSVPIRSSGYSLACLCH